MENFLKKTHQKKHRNNFLGNIVAIVTPMKQDGNIDKVSLKKIIEYHIREKTNSIVIFGTTGEFSKITRKEYLETIFSAVEYSDNKIPIIVGNNSISTEEAILTNKLVQCSKISGCLINSPISQTILSQEELYIHFKKIAESSEDSQILLYNVPSRTKQNLSPSTISRLSEIDNIIGIKETSSDLKRMLKIKEVVNEDFIILSGNDLNFFDFMLAGADGVISVVANIAANLVFEICYSIRLGKIRKAKKIYSNLKPLIIKLSYSINPIPIKFACHKIGLIRSNYSRIEFRRDEKFKKFQKSLENFLLNFF
ncbi:hypothetical protein AOE57_00665 [Candidatus Riesia pediculicola]|nr:hypothetical protein AOE57_00665 [Candidatus Riesia pediculicola]